MSGIEIFSNSNVAMTSNEVVLSRTTDNVAGGGATASALAASGHFNKAVEQGRVMIEDIAISPAVGAGIGNNSSVLAVSTTAKAASSTDRVTIFI